MNEKYRIYITRKNQMNGRFAKVRIYIDGRYYGDIESGDTEVLLLDNSSHILQFCLAAADKNHWSNKYRFSNNSKDRQFWLYTKTKLLSVDVLLEEM